MRTVPTPILDEDREAVRAMPVCVGWIVQVPPTNQPLVDFPGNPGGPVAARSIVAARPADGPEDPDHQPVLLVLEGGDPARPIIVGFVRDAFVSSSPLPAATVTADRERAARLDDKRLVFDAEEEIVLRCGKSSVTLRRDGRIVLKGTDIVSRASETNKIKGGTVAIN